MTPGRSITLPEANQHHVGPGLYAVVQLFSKHWNGDDAKNQASNSLIGRCKHDESRNSNGLYLVGVRSIAEPMVGIPDNNSQQFSHGRALGPEQYLFLIYRHKQSMVSMLGIHHQIDINTKCHHHQKKMIGR
jgi:hypothetical protein